MLNVEKFLLDEPIKKTVELKEIGSNVLSFNVKEGF